MSGRGPASPGYGSASASARPSSAGNASVRSFSTGVSAGLASVLTSTTAASRRLTHKDVSAAAREAREQLLRLAVTSGTGSRPATSSTSVMGAIGAAAGAVTPAAGQAAAGSAVDDDAEALRSVLAPREDIDRLMAQLRDAGAASTLSEVLEPRWDSDEMDDGDQYRGLYGTGIGMRTGVDRAESGLLLGSTGIGSARVTGVMVPAATGTGTGIKIKMSRLKWAPSITPVAEAGYPGPGMASFSF